MSTILSAKSVLLLLRALLTFFLKQNIEIICLRYPFLPRERDCAWRRMTNARPIFTLRDVSFKPHIFNPTKKLLSKLRKQHFFVGAYCVYQFSINSKVSRRFPRGVRWSLAKDFRDRDTISSASRRAASRAKQNVGWKPGVRKIHCAKKGEWGRRGKTKAASMAAEESAWRVI